MPFGLKNSPATFMREMGVILASVKWKISLMYLDDVDVFSNTIEDHIDNLKVVLELFKNAGVTLKPEKCFFFQKKIDYLRNVIRLGSLVVGPQATEAIEKLKTSSNLTELRSFPGRCNVLRWFVLNFARISAPRNLKLRKGRTVILDSLNEE